MEKMNLFQNDNLSLQIWLNQSRSNKIQERKIHMNNQFIMPPINFIFVFLIDDFSELIFYVSKHVFYFVQIA